MIGSRITWLRAVEGQGVTWSFKLLLLKYTPEIHKGTSFDPENRNIEEMDGGMD